MKFTLTQPCDQCPFRRGTPIRLSKERAREIASLMLSAQGGTFPCHKTIDYDKYEDDGDLDPNASHCAGALIFAEKNGNATQYMRIAERLGLYEAAKLMTKSNKRLVLDSLKEMAAQIGIERDEVDSCSSAPLLKASSVRSQSDPRRNNGTRRNSSAARPKELIREHKKSLA